MLDEQRGFCQASVSISMTEIRHSGKDRRNYWLGSFIFLFGIGERRSHADTHFTTSVSVVACDKPDAVLVTVTV
jgi:hypothetical protein